MNSGTVIISLIIDGKWEGALFRTKMKSTEMYRIRVKAGVLQNEECENL